MTTEKNPVMIEVKLQPWQAEALARWRIPPDHCGPSLRERIEWLIDDMCIHIENEERRNREIAEEDRPDFFF